MKGKVILAVAIALFMCGITHAFEKSAGVQSDVTKESLRMKRLMETHPSFRKVEKPSLYLFQSTSPSGCVTLTNDSALCYAIFSDDGDGDGVLNSVDQCPNTPLLLVKSMKAEWGPEGETETIVDGVSSDFVYNGVRMRYIGPQPSNQQYDYPSCYPNDGKANIRILDGPKERVVFHTYDTCRIGVPGMDHIVRWIQIEGNNVVLLFSKFVNRPPWEYEPFRAYLDTLNANQVPYGCTIDEGFIVK